MNTLAIDTATGISVGVAKDGKPVVSLREEDTRSHAELTQSLVNKALDMAGVGLDELSLIVAGIGPGPFTGLRVGIVAATVSASLLQIPVKGVCSLDAIALSAQCAENFVVATDARRKEVYWATYRPDRTRIGEPQVSAPEQVPDLPVCGPALEKYPDLGVGAFKAELDAGILAAEASQLADLGTSPIYLRKPDASLPSKRKSTLTHRRLTIPKAK